MPKDTSKHHDNNAKWDEDDWGVPPSKIHMSAEEAAKQASMQPGHSNMLFLYKMMVSMAFIVAFFGYVNGHDIVKSAEENGYSLVELLNVRSQNSSQNIYDHSSDKALDSSQDSSKNSNSDAGAANFNGTNSDVPTIDALEESESGAKTLTVTELLALKNKLQHEAGPFVDKGAIGSAIWYFVSSIVGSLCLVVPLHVYTFKAKKVNALQNSSAAFIDVITSVFLKYAIMALMLFVSFKFLNLINGALILSLVILMVLDVISKASSSMNRARATLNNIQNEKAKDLSRDQHDDVLAHDNELAKNNARPNAVSSNDMDNKSDQINESIKLEENPTTSTADDIQTKSDSELNK